MLALFIPITHLQNFETFKPAINMFNKDSKFRKFTVKQFLLYSQSSIFGFLKRNNAISMYVTNALKTFIANN